MGGLLVIVTVAVLTILFNWSRNFTYVPIGVMIFSALLGAIDDILNIFGHERHSRRLDHVFRLIRVHKEWRMRVWYALSLPWTAFKRLSVWFGSRTRRGVFVHEKLILQFIAGALTAWWIYAKLGPAWHFIYFPFDFSINAGLFIVPIIIFIVMFTANAVNIADGMDGLAGGTLIITFSALTLLSWINGFGEIAILNATTVGALAAYTYFNIKPARFMMGDVGSLGLGGKRDGYRRDFLIALPWFHFLYRGFIRSYPGLLEIRLRPPGLQDGASPPPLRAIGLERGKNCHEVLGSPFHLRSIRFLVSITLNGISLMENSNNIRLLVRFHR